MKNFILPLLTVSLFGLYSCSTPRQTASRYSDDIYYSAKDAPVKKPEPQKPQPRIYPDDTQYQAPTQNNQAAPPQEYYEPEYSVGGQGSVTNNYYGDVNNFNSDDYYDYSYTARLRRFHQPAMGMAYYDPWFTNAYYYSYDPFMWGTSIYMGYNFWNPRPWGGWGIGFGYGYGWGWGWGGGWGYPGWCGGWGYSGWGGGGYWTGYNHGYYDGLATNYYYNSFDRTIQNSHYGPRGGGSGGGFAGRSVSQQRSIGQLYQSSVASEIPRGGSATSRGDIARGNSSAASERNQAAGRGTEQISRGNTSETTNRPSRGTVQNNGQAADLSRISRGNAANATEGAVIARPGRDGATVNPNARNTERATRGATTNEAVNPRTGATSRESQVPARGTETRQGPNAQEKNTLPAARPGTQSPQTQNPYYSRQQAQPQARPNVQPNPSAQPQRGQAGQQQQARPEQDYSRQNIYNSPKRNPNAYQPSAQPGNIEGNRPSYNRQPAFESPQQRNNSQPQHRTYQRQQPSQQRPGYSPSQPQQRQSSPSYSAPSRSSSPSYSSPSRGSSPSYSAPSGGGSSGGGGGSAPRGGGGGSAPRSPR